MFFAFPDDNTLNLGITWTCRIICDISVLKIIKKKKFTWDNFLSSSGYDAFHCYNDKI